KNATETGKSTRDTMSPERKLEARKRNNRQRAGITAAAMGVFLIIGFLFLRSTGQDDAYISYWPAHTLAHYGRIINYTGEAVEQSSSMLWVLVLGALAFITRAP